MPTANPYSALLPGTSAPKPGGPGRGGQMLRKQPPPAITGAGSNPYHDLMPTGTGGAPQSQPTFPAPGGAPRGPAGEVAPDSRTPGGQPDTVSAPPPAPPPLADKGGKVPGQPGFTGGPGPVRDPRDPAAAPPVVQPPTMPGGGQIPEWMLPPGGVPKPVAPVTTTPGQPSQPGTATSDMGMPGGEFGQRPRPAESQAAPSPYAALAEGAPTADSSFGQPPGFIDVEPPPVTETPPPTDDTPTDEDASGDDWWTDTSNWQDESGAITWLPSDPASMEAFLKAQGWYGTDATRRFTNLTTALGKYQNAVAQGNSGQANLQLQRIERAIKNLGEIEGIAINQQELINSWGQGLSGPGDTPTGPGAGIVPGEGTDIGGFPDFRYETIPEWMKNMDPENLRAYMDYLNFNLARDDRQLAIDQYQNLFDLYDNDPTRQSLYGMLEDKPQTYSDEDVAKMKASSAQTYGDANASITSDIRERAAQLGVPASDLASMEMRARGESALGLTQQDRDIDKMVAESKMSDWERYYNALSGAQQTLLGPYASMYGSLTGLISGAPNLANTGNPMQGVGDYRLQQQILGDNGPGTDYASLLLNAGGAFAGGYASK